MIQNKSRSFILVCAVILLFVGCDKVNNIHNYSSENSGSSTHQSTETNITSETQDNSTETSSKSTIIPTPKTAETNRQSETQDNNTDDTGSYSDTQAFVLKDNKPIKNYMSVKYRKSYRNDQKFCVTNNGDVYFMVCNDEGIEIHLRDSGLSILFQTIHI